MKKTNGHVKGHIEVLDGLRAIAILWVVFFHIWELSWLHHSFFLFGKRIDFSFFPSTGVLGVEVFLFVSGFCLFLPYSNAIFLKKKNPTNFEFYFKRLLKIVPSYFLAIALICLFDPKQSFSSFYDGLKQILGHAFFLNNLFPELYNSKINGVFWSLAVEVQFYLIFPLVVFLFRKMPFITFLGLCSVSIGYRLSFCDVFGPNHVNRFLLNQLPAFFDLFACGMMGAYLLAWHKKNQDRVSILKKSLLMTIGSLLSLAFLVWLAISCHEIRYGFKGIPAWQAKYRVVMGLGLLSFSVFTLLSSPIWNRVFANRAIVFISGISYNWYIWHQLLARRLKEADVLPHQNLNPQADRPWGILFTVVAIPSTLLVAWLITRFFESPLLLRGKRWLLKRKTSIE